MKVGIQIKFCYFLQPKISIIPLTKSIRQNNWGTKRQMVQSIGNRISFVLHACLSGQWITNLKCAFIPSNRIAPSTQHFKQKVKFLTTRTTNQGFEEKLFAQAIRAHPENRIADTNFIRPCAIKTNQSTWYNHVVNNGRNTEPLIRDFGGINLEMHWMCTLVRFSLL